LVKAFKERRVVSGVSIAIRPGEVVGLLGPNGAGKTTTFYMILGLIRPDRGRVLLNGEEITPLPVYERARRGIGFLPQEASVFRRLTVKENLMAILEMLPLSGTERMERADHLLHELSIAHLADAPAYTLSGGSGGGPRSRAPWRRLRPLSSWMNPLPGSIPLRSAIFRPY